MLAATIPGPLLRFLYTEITQFHFQVCNLQLGPLGQQLIFGWPSGPATDHVRPEGVHDLLLENGATDMVL